MHIKNNTNRSSRRRSEDDEADKKLELDDQYTDTYDPIGKEDSHEWSGMGDYKSGIDAKKKPKGSFKVNPNKNIILSQIKEDLDDINNDTNNNNHLNTPKFKMGKHKNGNSTSQQFKRRVSAKHREFDNGYISKRDMAELLSLDLSVDQLPSPHKRCIFISIAQLNACIDIIPHYILSESIFCFKAERSWFFPSNHIERKQSRQSIRHKLNFNSKFLNVLHEKDSKNLILWLSDNKSWTNISNELSEINDIYYTGKSSSNLSAAPTDSNEEDDDNKQNNNKKHKNHTAAILRLPSEPEPEPEEITQPINTIKYSPLKLDVSWWLHNFKNRVDGIESLYCDSGSFFIFIIYDYI